MKLDELEERHDARLLVMHKRSGDIEIGRFVDLPHYLRGGDVVVLNNSQTLNASCFAWIDGVGRLEIQLRSNLDGNATHRRARGICLRSADDLRSIRPGSAAPSLVPVPTRRSGCLSSTRTLISSTLWRRTAGPSQIDVRQHFRPNFGSASQRRRSMSASQRLGSMSDRIGERCQPLFCAQPAQTNTNQQVTAICRVHTE